MISAKVIEDSISPHSIRLVTFQLKYPRIVHAEFMTHRVFSRNASSSRAIPVAKILEQVRTNPAMPCHWGTNQPGMQAGAEVDEAVRRDAKATWRAAAEAAADYAEFLMNLGLHKQVCNRLLEPFQFMHVVVTSTEWDNFFELRDHDAAEPNIRALAVAMKAVMEASEPTFRPRIVGLARAWHLPYVSYTERVAHSSDPALLAKLSTARCARVSYVKHDGTTPSIEEDLQLFDRLVGSKPMHASPAEHQACAATRDIHSGNFRGWVQHRKTLEVA